MRPDKNLELVVVLCMFASAACDNQPAEGKPKATVQEVTQVAAPEPPKPSLAAATYAFNQDNSKIEFIGAKITGKHDGSFKTFSGSIGLREGPGSSPAAGLVRVEIDIASLAVEPEKLSQHLKSPDLLDAQKFPKATFNSTTVKPQADSTYTVEGYFQLHGVTKQISFPATIRSKPDQVEVDAEFAINRKDFGITYPGKPDDLIKDDVLIKLTIRAPKS
ncbi:MAG TPA: YceI family protein [Polyangiales bacterium]|nr:YceI family protein [Polyangiales bacterium]